MSYNILPDTRLTRIQDINDALSDLEKKDVHYRYVIDMQSLNEAA